MVRNPMVEKNETNTFNKSKLNHYHQPQTKLAKPPPVDILVHWWRSPILPPWKFWNGGWWGFVGEVRLHTPLKENITNTNRWMFKPLRVMYSKATGKPWKLWDEGPCNSSNVIICWVLPLPILTNEGLAVGFPTKTDQNPGKGAIQTICHQQTDCLFGSWYRPSFLWNEIYSTPTNQSTVPFVTPWSRIFILEKKRPANRRNRRNLFVKLAHLSQNNVKI